MPPRKRAETLPTEAAPPVSADPADTTPAAVEPPDDKPNKSDLQTVEQPCSVCFPNGWADGAFSHGCEHGTWIRDNT